MITYLKDKNVESKKNHKKKQNENYNIEII